MSYSILDLSLSSIGEHPGDALAQCQPPVNSVLDSALENLPHRENVVLQPEITLVTSFKSAGGSK